MLRYSVVVATYNRAELLRGCLRSLASQSVGTDEYEIIVVNDGSRDHTDVIADDFRKSHPEVRFLYLKQKNRGPAAARNAGTKNARGKIVFFTDDDCVVPYDWIETLAAGYVRNPEVAGVGGWYRYPREYYQRHSPFVKSFISYSQALFYIKCMEAGCEEIKNSIFLRNPAGNTSNMSYRREILEKSGGFDETISFVGLVDWELKQRILGAGYPLLYIPYHVTHTKPLNAREVMRKFFNIGRGGYHLTKKNPALRPFYLPTAGRALWKIKTIANLLKHTSDFPFSPLSLRQIAWCEFIVSRTGWVFQKWQEG